MPRNFPMPGCFGVMGSSPKRITMVLMSGTCPLAGRPPEEPGVNGSRLRLSLYPGYQTTEARCLVVKHFVHTGGTFLQCRWHSIWTLQLKQERLRQGIDSRAVVPWIDTLSCRSFPPFNNKGRKLAGIKQILH